MSISVHNNNASRLSPMKAAQWAPSRPVDGEDRKPAQDRVDISQAGKDSLDNGEALSPIERAIRNTTKEDFMAQLDAWRQEHKLEVNWNATVDPDGSIYAKAYMDGLASQYEKDRRTIEAYYAQGHQENLRFANPYNHLVEKYKYSGSPYFMGDLPQAQRDMAFRQEEALLRGGRVALNDPWALAASGGVPRGKDVEANARAYAQSVLDDLIAQYKKDKNIIE